MALTLAQSVSGAASPISYFSDFMGGLCLRESDLEKTYAGSSGNGWHAVPVCMAAPCAGELARADYGRRILGRDATDAEWTDYRQMWSLVCTLEDPPDSLTMLVQISDTAGLLRTAGDMLPLSPAGRPAATGMLPVANAEQTTAFLAGTDIDGTSATTSYKPLFAVVAAGGGSSGSARNSAATSQSAGETAGTQPEGDAPAPQAGEGTSVPLPGSGALLLAGLGGLALLARRGKRHAQAV